VKNLLHCYFVRYKSRMYRPGKLETPWRRTMWHAELEVLSEVIVRIILLRDVTTFCVVDICQRLRKTGWLYLLCIRKTKLSYKVRDGGLICNISTFQHEKWLVTTQNKESVSYRGIFLLKKSIHFSQFIITALRQVCKRHDFADLSSIVHYVLETNPLYGNAYFREYFFSN
jgi:hypothetical protein